ncbi:hypothetical protein PPN31119_01484 [Pandoraea pnomenusa]|uniref:Uncharacterized protein n=1 Tax=Pandoraea pnomenusa TaxID=93220 RepID=A0ABY6WHB3_9BURK|nr:hypothetical protein PPN31119_01484 [Pandoraea pnomenusa]
MEDGIWHFSASDDSLNPMGDKPDTAPPRTARPARPACSLAAVRNNGRRFRRLLANFWHSVGVFVPKYRQFA